MDANGISRKVLLLIVLLAPPIGTFLLWTREDIPRWCKLCALGYTAAVLYLLLTWRAPTCGTEIDAQQWNDAVTVSATSLSDAALTVFFVPKHEPKQMLTL